MAGVRGSRHEHYQKASAFTHVDVFGAGRVVARLSSRQNRRTAAAPNGAGAPVGRRRSRTSSGSRRAQYAALATPNGMRNVHAARMSAWPRPATNPSPAASSRAPAQPRVRLDAPPVGPAGGVRVVRGPEAGRPVAARARDLVRVHAEHALRRRVADPVDPQLEDAGPAGHCRA